VKTYLSDFHGSTVSIYRDQAAGADQPARPIAVCTDCHGTHDIKSMSALGPGTVKAQLLRKCRQCHEDASVAFPDAWLSHYTPSLSRTPVLFIVDRSYMVLLPLMLVFGFVSNLLYAAIGSLLRYAVVQLVMHLHPQPFPIGTILVNVVGSFAIGLLMARYMSQDSESAKLFFVTGLLGGFTTFSAFSWDALQLLERGQMGGALLYVGASVFLSLAAVAGGYQLGR
jgi:CrcB protein